MEVYRVGENTLSQIPPSELSTEAQLEEHLVKSQGAVIGGVELLYIGRQESPTEGGIFDILALDRAGNLVIVELKRGRTPRDIVAQALEYASGLRNDDYEDLSNRYRRFLREHHQEAVAADEPATLQEAHAAFFDREADPVSTEAFNTEQRLVLIATDFREVALNMADFLRDHEVDVVCVEYQAFGDSETDDIQLLTTQPIRRPLSEEPTGSSGTDELTDGERTRRAFWDDVAEAQASQAGVIDPLSPAPVRYRYPVRYGNGIGLKTILNTGEGRVYVLLRIRNDRPLYDRLYEDRAAIESELPDVEWIPTEETGAQSDNELCKIQVSRSIDFDDPDEWDAAIDWVVDRLDRFHQVFADRIDS